MSILFSIWNRKICLMLKPIHTVHFYVVYNSVVHRSRLAKQTKEKISDIYIPLNVIRLHRSNVCHEWTIDLYLVFDWKDDLFCIYLHTFHLCHLTHQHTNVPHVYLHARHKFPGIWKKIIHRLKNSVQLKLQIQPSWCARQQYVIR